MYLSLIDVELTVDAGKLLDSPMVTLTVSKNHQPLYGYKSVKFDAVASGNSVVTGYIAINKSDGGKEPGIEFFNIDPSMVGRLIYNLILTEKPADTEDTDISPRQSYRIPFCMLQSCEELKDVNLPSNIQTGYVLLGNTIEKL